MPTDDGSAEGASWPMPKFRFEVDLATELKGISFQEAYGMDTENQIIEYRKTNSPHFSPENMPGIANAVDTLETAHEQLIITNGK